MEEVCVDWSQSDITLCEVFVEILSQVRTLLEKGINIKIVIIPAMTLMLFNLKVVNILIEIHINCV